MSFTIFQNRKTPVQAIKTRSSNSRKIDIFPKGLTHAFGPKKWPFFPLVFLGNIRQGNVFYGILEQKNAFLGYKNKKFKNSKNCHFSKGVNPWYWYKNGHFSKFLFNQQRQGKCLLRYSREKKTQFQALKTRSSKSRKIDIFPKGLSHGFGPKMVVFPTFFFQAIQARKMSFTIFQSEKTPFQAIKTRSSKSRKIDILVLVEKWPFFQPFFSRQYRSGTCLL